MVIGERLNIPPHPPSTSGHTTADAGSLPVATHTFTESAYSTKLDIDHMLVDRSSTASAVSCPLTAVRVPLRSTW